MRRCRDLLNLALSRLDGDDLLTEGAVDYVEDFLFFRLLDLFQGGCFRHGVLGHQVGRNSFQQSVELILVQLPIQVAVGLLAELVVLVLEILALSTVGIVVELLHRRENLRELLQDARRKAVEVESVAVKLAEQIVQVEEVVIIIRFIIKLFEFAAFVPGGLHKIVIRVVIDWIRSQLTSSCPGRRARSC